MLFVSATVALALKTPTDPQKPKQEPVPLVGDLTGIYSCRGTDSKGKAYAGAATIRRFGETFIVEWTSGSAVGVGQRTGDTLSVGWKGTQDNIGVTVYKIGPGPTLTGQWLAAPGNGQKGQEVLEFLKAIPEE